MCKTKLATDLLTDMMMRKIDPDSQIITLHDADPESFYYSRAAVQMHKTVLCENEPFASVQTVRRMPTVPWVSGVPLMSAPPLNYVGAERGWQKCFGPLLRHHLQVGHASFSQYEYGSQSKLRAQQAVGEDHANT
jgi:hypothetical protein